MHGIEFHVVAVRNDRGPVLARRVDDRCRHQLEVARVAALVRNDQKAVAAFFAPVVLDVVFVAGIARRNNAWRRLRCVAGNEPDLRRGLRGTVDQHEAAAERATDVDEETFVVLAANEHVGCRVGTEHVPPHFERSHRVVGPNVKTRARVVRPREAVRDVLDDVVEVGARRKIAEVQRVALTPVGVDGIRGNVVIGSDVEAAECEVVVAVGELVLVEQNNGVGRRRAARPATVLRVLQTFYGPYRVLPRSVGHRRRFVGFLHAPFDLGEDPVAQSTKR